MIIIGRVTSSVELPGHVLQGGEQIIFEPATVHRLIRTIAGFTRRIGQPLRSGNAEQSKELIDRPDIPVQQQQED